MMDVKDRSTFIEQQSYIFINKIRHVLLTPAPLRFRDSDAAEISYMQDEITKGRFRSDGELENEESLAMNVLKMLHVGEPLAQIVGKIEKMRIAFPDHVLEVIRSGKYVFIAKRAINN
ncbi:unnamed protein product [Gongylonema pulchrum]|uniref:DUF1874 domain-containing protein n=1 Tax=Gongylonema pulchrum TaxID=637853 RepID=A0A183DZ12_9BILA|nr:unnamed protein product [Gongylonema pulchrum]